MIISQLFHPDYIAATADWAKWRLTYTGGQAFVDMYLRKLSKREDDDDFADRKAVTYCPAFAKVGLNEIRDAIYQRTCAITREGGSKTFNDAIAGLSGGVDLEGSSMNYFMGCKILPELLAMSKVGIYVDMPPLIGESVAANSNLRPYVYMYPIEDIHCWINDESATNSDFSAVLLEDRSQVFDEVTGFPFDVETRYRFLKKDENGRVWASFYNAKGEPVDQFGRPDGIPIQLNVTRIPFLVVEISESLLTDVADYQIALLNLASTDMSYALKANYPFYTEQRDVRTGSEHLKIVSEGQEQKTEEVKVGVTRGRRYPKGLDRPGFIHPSPEPLRVSMEKQEQLKEEIRLLLKLTISNLKAPRASAESKQEDAGSLESGLSYIGLALEMAERKIAEFWAMYEGAKTVATVSYPENYSLRSEQDILKEVDSLEGIMSKIPSLTFQKSLAKRIASLVLGTKVARETMVTINSELDKAPAIVADPKVIAQDVETGLLGLDLASQIRGYPKDEVAKAKKDHAERLARIAISQSENPAARGNPDLSGNPGQAAKDEKTESRDTTTDDTVTDKTRGEGR
jgi:hypothetical protein